MKEKNNKFLVIITILTIVFTITGGTLAYWGWSSNTNEKTNVVFSVGRDFSCAVDGGGDIDNTDAFLVPTTCTDPDRAIQTEVKVTPTISKDGLTIDMDLWLDINTIAPELASSRNFKYALTTNSNSCTDGVVSTGNFYGKADNGRISILNKSYTRLTEDIEPETYYLYIWLDKYETNSNTMNKRFNFSLGGNCSDYQSKPEAPVLDDGMIPVTISSDGTINAVSEYDSSWYNYDEKKWANVVLVNKEATEGVEGSYSREDYLTKIANNEDVVVNESDILAYYVWIPRYKYKIPYKKCSDIPEEERNMEDYPECYAPYTMPDSDKKILGNYYTDQQFGLMSFSDEFSELILMNFLLENGSFFKNTRYGESVVSWVNAYNETNQENIITLTSSEFNNNNTLNGPGDEVSIDIAFESVTSHISKGNAVDTYYTHPAFIWGGETIPGIWVGKFETSTDPTTECYTSAINCNNSSHNPRIVPSVRCLERQAIGNQFKTSLNFAGGRLNSDGSVEFEGNSYYGLTNKTDSHMMKNSEWGVVAYLSHSKYGINSEVYINDSYILTGRSSGSVDTDSCRYGSYTWLGESVSSGGTIGDITDPTLGTNASTTGNVYGIYDMSGGCTERVMGNYNNTANEATFPTLPDNKYYDVYLAEQFNLKFPYSWTTNNLLCTLDTCGGHALLETSNWNGDKSFFVDSGKLWFTRGGEVNNNFDKTGLFYSDSESGSDISSVSWRSALIVDK